MPSSANVPVDPSAQNIAFLNYLDDDVAQAFSDEIINGKDRLKLINQEHLKCCTIEELGELKGFDGQDGKLILCLCEYYLISLLL